MSTTDDQNSSTLTDNDRPRNEVHSQLLFNLDKGAWLQDDRRASTDIADARTFTLAEARKIIDTYPPNTVLMFDAVNGGKFELYKRLVIAGHKALGGNRSMTGSVGTQQETQHQSNR